MPIFRDLRILSPEDIESWGYWILRIWNPEISKNWHYLNFQDSGSWILRIWNPAGKSHESLNTCKEPQDGSYNERGWVKTLVFLKVAKCNFSDKLFWSTKFGIKIWLLLNWIKSFQLTRDALKFYSSKSMHGRDLEHSYKTFFAAAGIRSLSGEHQKSLIPIAIWLGRDPGWKDKWRVVIDCQESANVMVRSSINQPIFISPPRIPGK